jgi:HSP20 family protein
MAIVRWDPWSDMARLRRELDKVFGEREGAWMPAADVTRDEDGITMKVDLPGMTADDVKVELRDSQLVVTGERKQETEEKHEGMVSRERVFGSFMRSIALPAGVGADDVKARFANGELTVEVSLPAEAEGKQIEVHTPEAAAV